MYPRKLEGSAEVVGTFRFIFFDEKKVQRLGYQSLLCELVASSAGLSFVYVHSTFLLGYVSSIEAWFNSDAFAQSCNSRKH